MVGDRVPIAPIASSPSFRTSSLQTRLTLTQTSHHSAVLSRLTACVSGLRVGWENAWEQKKSEARKMLEKRAESRKSTARFVSPLLYFEDDFLSTILSFFLPSRFFPTLDMLDTHILMAGLELVFHRKLSNVCISQL